MNRPRALFLFASIALNSCGSKSSSSDGPSNSLEGTTWIETITSDCGFGLIFSTGNQYSLITLCITNSQGKTANASIAKGSYVIDENQKNLVLTPLQSTCDSKPIISGPYELSSSLLSYTTTNKKHAFTPNTATGDSDLLITTGCYADNGTFTAGALK